jgi:hypothetical protein
MKKDLYGLKQAPHAWYHRLDMYLKDKGFKRGTIDNNLYIKIEDNDLLIVLVYVDDIDVIRIHWYNGFLLPWSLSLKCL